MLYITNGFSPSMLKLPTDVEFKEVGKEEFSVVQRVKELTP